MIAVIMAGGSGTRFWPRSRERMPKQLLSLVNERSMLQNTIDRLGDLVTPEQVLVVSTATQADAIRQQLSNIPEENIIVEPKGKNTAPCIGLAALYARRRDPDSVMVVLPADHLIEGEEQFRQVLRTGERLARETEALVTIGIKPTYPSTGYGYIQFGDLIEKQGDVEAYRVKTFAEKPTLEVAKRFLNSGDFLWNSGIFIWKTATILQHIEELLPELYNGLMEIDKALGTPEEAEVVNRVYCQIRSVSIDYGVMEHAKNVIVLKATFSWNDLGTWEEVYKISPKDENGNAITGLVVHKDTKNSLIDSPHRLIATLGVEDLVVVDSGDAILICHRDRAQEVRDIVEILRRKGLKEYL
ncbi:MAG: NTP transferase domain-containing protein [Calditrichaeota bacterium]|nr:NTP transferase domain-containing protein [Calditrichota bacterium]